MRKLTCLIVVTLLLQAVFPVWSVNAYSQVVGIEEAFIDFQSSWKAPDVLSDRGDLYAEKNHYVYGWNKLHLGSTLTQGGHTKRDGIALAKDSIWEFAVYNGIYEVTVGVFGTSSEKNSISLLAENMSLWEMQHLTYGQQAEKTILVQVTDGRFTIAANADNVAIDYVSIVPQSVIIQKNSVKTSEVVDVTEGANNSLLVEETDSQLQGAIQGGENSEMGDSKQEEKASGSDPESGTKTESESNDLTEEEGAPEIKEPVAEVPESEEPNQGEGIPANKESEKEIPEVLEPEPGAQVPEVPGGQPIIGELPVINDGADVILQMYNRDRTSANNAISPQFQLTNNGTTPLNLNKVKIRYYFTVDGDREQNFFCDWSTIGSGNITGQFVKMPITWTDADYYLEIGFIESAGVLEPGRSVEIQTRFSKATWPNYLQENDYSFSAESAGYTDWQKAIVHYDGEMVWGETGIEGSLSNPYLPGIPENPGDPLTVQMYNGNRTADNNTIFPWFRVYNTSHETILLEDIIIRYYFTSEGEEPLLYEVDHSNTAFPYVANVPNIEGRFSKFTKPRPGGDHYFELGFGEDAGSLTPGQYVEVHTRLFKEGWSNFNQADDFSFNAVADNFVNWTKVNGYYKGFFVWGEADFFDIPENLLGQATETTVDLQWDPVESAALYDLEIDGVVHSVGGDTVYQHAELSPGTLHTYRVRAKTDRVTGNWSEPLEIYTIPDIPRNMSGESTSESITIHWDQVVGADTYDVEIYGAPVEVLEGVSYQHSGLSPNMQLTYRVRAKNSSGAGQWSSVFAYSTLPSVPSALNGQATDKDVKIFWNATAGATAYDLEIDGFVITDISATTYLHEYVEANSNHSYRIRAKNQNGTTEWSEILTITTLPPIPENIHGTSVGKEVLVFWDAADGATAYQIEVDGVVVDNGSGTSYVHTELPSNSVHTYRVRALNGDIVGPWSQTITKTTLLNGIIQLSANAGSTQVTVSWDMVPGAVSYDIEVNGTVFNHGLSTVFTHENLTPNEQYTYRVRAVNAGGADPWSEPITATTLFGTPQNITTSPAATSMAISWEAVEGATGYDVFADGQVYEIGNVTNYTHIDLEPYTWHVYRIRAKADGIIGEWSAGITQATLLGTPGNLRFEPASDQITVIWDTVVSANQYQIEIDGKVYDIGDFTSYMHQNLETSTVYEYRVRAIRDDERPEWSSISDWTSLASVRTLSGPPKNIQATATTEEIILTWEAVEDAITYDVEIDGQIVEAISEEQYVAKGLKPNTYHSFKVRSVFPNIGGYAVEGESERITSEWSDHLAKNTIPELTINVPKDNQFNFVIIAPPKKDKDTLNIIVTYDDQAVEVINLSANAPQVILEPGQIPGTAISIIDFIPGQITYTVENAVKTTTNTIAFMSKSDDFSKITYLIE